MVAVAASPFGGVLHRQGVHVGEHGEGFVVSGGRVLQQVLLEQRPAAQEQLEIGRQPLLDERLDCLGAGALVEVHAVRVVLVTTFAVLPGHDGVVLELVEPRADKRVAALDLVVQEAEWQLPIHGLDPERQPAQLDGERIEVNGVDAALDHVAAQHRLEPRLEVGVVRRAGDQFVAQARFRAACLVANAE